MPDLDLRATIRDVLDGSSLTEPTDVADKVFAGLDPADYGEALRQTLRQYVRLIMTDRPAPAPAPEQGGNSARSWKVSGIRDQWQRWLMSRVFTEAGWKQIKDCTRADVLYLVRERREIAERNIAVAEQYERIADLMKRRRVKTVGDLPQSVLSEAIGEAA